MSKRPFEDAENPISRKRVKTSLSQDEVVKITEKIFESVTSGKRFLRLWQTLVSALSKTEIVLFFNKKRENAHIINEVARNGSTTVMSILLKYFNPRPLTIQMATKNNIDSSMFEMVIFASRMWCHKANTFVTTMDGLQTDEEVMKFFNFFKTKKWGEKTEMFCSLIIKSQIFEGSLHQVHFKEWYKRQIDMNDETLTEDEDWIDDSDDSDVGEDGAVSDESM